MKALLNDIRWLWRECRSEIALVVSLLAVCITLFVGLVG